jgi:outer membrane protein OmpA-like peptidoglycan-associated protein
MMNRRTSLSFLFVAVIFYSFSAALAQVGDVGESKDHPLISRYTDSQIIGYEIKEYDALLLPLGKTTIDSKKGIPVFSKSQSIEGKVTRILYVAPEGRSTLEVFRNYQTALKKAEFETLLTCALNECGGQFQPLIYPLERRLRNKGQVSEYALEFPKDQRYMAARLSRPERQVHVSLYVAINGINNFKETYNHPVVLLEVVETKVMETEKVTVNAEAMAKDLGRTGHVSIYGIYFDTDKAEIKPGSEPTVKEMAKLLRENPGLKVYIVGHTDNVGSLTYNLDLSQRRAESVVKALVTLHGADRTRMVANGVGPLAPMASNKTEEGRSKNRRVELVEQ